MLSKLIPGLRGHFLNKKIGDHLPALLMRVYECVISTLWRGEAGGDEPAWRNFPSSLHGHSILMCKDYFYKGRVLQITKGSTELNSLKQLLSLETKPGEMIYSMLPWNLSKTSEKVVWKSSSMFSYVQNSFSDAARHRVRSPSRGTCTSSAFTSLFF